MKVQKLYAIRNPLTGLIKIGIATNPTKRRADLECGAGTALELLIVQEANHPKRAEAYLHKKLEAHKQFREWFLIEDRQQLEIMFQEAAQLEVITREKVRPSESSNRIRAEVKRILFEEGISQAQLAEKMGAAPQYVSEMLNADSSILPSRLGQLLEYLDLELFVRKKGDDGNSET